MTRSNALALSTLALALLVGCAVHRDEAPAARAPAQAVRKDEARRRQSDPPPPRAAKLSGGRDESDGIAQLAQDAAVRREVVLAAEAASMMPGESAVAGYVGTPTPELSDGGFDTEAYAHVPETGFRRAAEQPLSTFSIDVDTASYANVRRFLDSGQLPPADAVRIEELLNTFRYDDPEPRGDEPFSVTTETASCPWTPEHRLLRIGLRGRSVPERELPARNLVFLVDVSGSMGEPNKLPLVKESLRLLLGRLTSRDRVGIVVYAGAAGLVLEPTPADRRSEILRAIDGLQPGGSTNGAQGIELAYRLAERSFVDGGANRVVLCTDGDFNVGTTSEGELIRLIEREREKGVFLTVLGYGMGNLKDSTMESLADHGNGNYGYVDSLAEAKKILVDEADAWLVAIAKDVKIQVELNPATVEAWRLIGYENRALAAEDFNDDRKDAGEIGAGHAVTALYEIVPAGQAVAPGIDALRYQQPPRLSAAAHAGELATVKLRYKQPDGQRSRLIERIVRDDGGVIADASDDLRFAAAVATFGMTLRGSEFAGDASMTMARDLASQALGSDEAGHRAAFLELIDRAASLMPRTEAVMTR